MRQISSTKSAITFLFVVFGILAGAQPGQAKSCDKTKTAQQLLQAFLEGKYLIKESQSGKCLSSKKFDLIPTKGFGINTKPACFLSEKDSFKIVGKLKASGTGSYTVKYSLSIDPKLNRKTKCAGKTTIQDEFSFTLQETQKKIKRYGCGVMLDYPDTHAVYKKCFKP